jgi:hypothetical protein
VSWARISNPSSLGIGDLDVIILGAVGTSRCATLPIGLLFEYSNRR